MSDTSVENPMNAASSGSTKDRKEVIADAIKAGQKIDEILPESFSDILTGESLRKYGIATKKLLPVQGNDFNYDGFFEKDGKYVFYARGSPGYLLPVTCFNIDSETCYYAKMYAKSINVKESEGRNQYYITVDGNEVFGDAWKIIEIEPEIAKKNKTRWSLFGGNKTKSQRKSNKKRKQQKSKKQRKSRK